MFSSDGRQAGPSGDLPADAHGRPAGDPAGEVAADLTLPEGLVGLPALRRFGVAQLPGARLFRLDSLDDPGFGVVAALADDVRPGTVKALIARGLAAPGSTSLVLLSTHGDPPTITANLAGPIVVGPAAGTARQLVLDDAEFPLRAPISVPG